MRKKMFSLKPFSKDDQYFVEKMLEHSRVNREYELGYPKCDNMKELLAEVEMYENTLEKSIYIIFYEDKPIGISGYLYTPNEGDGYIIGPIVNEEFHFKEGLNIIINLVLDNKMEIFNTLEAVVSHKNVVLDQCYSELGWKYRRTSREMRYDIDGVKKEESQWKINLIDKSNKKIIDESFKLLDKAFRWNGNKKKMEELLNNEYKLACVLNERNKVIGFVCWAYLEDISFSRLEYVVVNEKYRKRGIGQALVNYVINSSIDDGVKCVYLSTNIINEAVNIYKAVGFYDTVISNIYREK